MGNAIITCVTTSGGDIIAADEYAIKFYMGRGHDVKKLLGFMVKSLPPSRYSLSRIQEAITRIKNERAEQKKD